MVEPWAQRAAGGTQCNAVIVRGVRRRGAGDDGEGGGKVDSGRERTWVGKLGRGGGGRVGERRGGNEGAVTEKGESNERESPRLQAEEG